MHKVGRERASKFDVAQLFFKKIIAQVNIHPSSHPFPSPLKRPAATGQRAKQPVWVQTCMHAARTIGSYIVRWQNTTHTVKIKKKETRIISLNLAAWNIQGQQDVRCTKATCGIECWIDHCIVVFTLNPRACCPRHAPRAWKLQNTSTSTK